MRAGSARALVYASLLAGTVGAFATGAQPWWRAVVADGEAPVSGNAASGSLTQALAVVTIAGLLLSLTLATRGRQVLGGVLALAGAGMVWVGVARPRPSDEAVSEAIRRFSLAVDPTLHPTPWSWGYAAAGLLVVLGGVLLVVLSPRWGGRRSRFERGPVTVDLDDPAAIWRAQDAGVDPTAQVDPTDETAVTSPQQDATPDRKSQR